MSVIFVSFLSSSLILALQLCSPINAEDAAKCMGQPITFGEARENLIKKCITEHHVSSADTISGCFLACKFGEIVSGGKFAPKKMEAYVNQVFPKAARPQLKKAFTACGAKAKTPLQDDEASDCKNYKEFGICLLMAFQTVCLK